jgi:hypothetical protein
MGPRDERGWNLSVKGEKLVYSLRKPFDLFVNAGNQCERFLVFRAGR